MKLASGIAPVAALLARGVNVALGTDGAASNNRLDLFSEMRLASLLAKVATGDAAALPAADGAAHGHARRRARARLATSRIGSLVPGKDADVVAVDLGGLDAAPCLRSGSHLVNVGGPRATSPTSGSAASASSTTRALADVDEAALAARAPAPGSSECADAPAPMTTTTDAYRTPTPPSSRNSRRSRIAGGIPESEFRPLHEINPLRLDWIERVAGGLAGKRVLDVGCGGGILAEAMAATGAQVTGIDLSEKALGVARLHQLESGVAVDYRLVAAEALAANRRPRSTSSPAWRCSSTCRDPASIVAACATLAKPGGTLVFSTLNRNPKSYLFAILGAEYVLRPAAARHARLGAVHPPRGARRRGARRAGLDLDRD